MPNAITFSKQCLDAVDVKFKVAPITAGMVKGDEAVKDIARNGEVSIMNVEVDGFGNFDRAGATGYAGGNTTVTWVPYKLECERSKTIGIDRLDDQQTLDNSFTAAVAEFADQYAVPEIDAYRFAKLAQRASLVATPATLSNTTVLQAYDVANEAMDEAGVPSEGRVFYCTNAIHTMLKQSNLITRNISVTANDGQVVRGVYELDDGTPVKKVPQNRFYTKITLNSGASTFGYVKDVATGKDINFILVHEPSVMAIMGHTNTKVITADANQTNDQNQYKLRIWHDLIVTDAKRKAIYLHNKA